MKLTKQYSIIILAFILFIISSNCTKNKEIITSFYYWKTNYNPTDFEKKYIKNHNVKNVYIRCFDVMKEYNENYKPSNILLWKQKPDTTLHYIPVVFLDKSIFEKIDVIKNIALANNIITLCKQIFDYQHIPFSEIQIDCDWANLSKENYFYFLQTIKKSIPIVSATLRLHQFKYQTKSGIPPVDYCSLMCYNVGDVKISDNSNSILNIIDFDSYTKGKTYPKPFNIALPIYTWNLIFRNNQLKKIITTKPLLDTMHWKQIGKTQYACKNNFQDSTSSTYFYANEVLEIEEWSKQEWNTITKQILQNINNQKHEIIYFDMDSTSIQNYLLP